MTVDSAGRQSRDGAGPGDQARIHIDGRVFIVLGDKGGHISIKRRSLPAIGVLNELWRAQAPFVVEVDPAGVGKPVVAINGKPLLEVLPGDHGGSDPMALARQWAAAIADAGRERGIAVRLEIRP